VVAAQYRLEQVQKGRELRSEGQRGHRCTVRERQT
jgi:hypothetical protein